MLWVETRVYRSIETRVVFLDVYNTLYITMRAIILLCYSYDGAQGHIIPKLDGAFLRMVGICNREQDEAQGLVFQGQMSACR